MPTPDYRNPVDIGSSAEIPPTPEQLSATMGALNSFPALGVYNANRGNTAKLKKSLGKVISGEARARWAFAGSSSFVGTGTNPPNYRAHSVIAYLAAALSGRGIRAQWDSIWGTQGYNDLAAHTIADPRTTFGAGWTNVIGSSLGGSMFSNQADTTDLQITFEGEYDAIDIYYNRLSGGGTFEVFIDDVSQGTQSTNAGAAVIKLIKTGFALGEHVLKIRRISGGQVNIIGVEAYDTTRPALNLLGMGWVGSASPDWASTTAARSPRNALPVVGPEATFLLIGNNDISAARATAIYKINMQTIIEGAKLSGDVIIVGPQEVNPAVYDQSLQDEYFAARLELATEFDCPLIDWKAHLGTFAQGSAIGAYADDQHVRRFAHAQFGQFMAEVLVRL